MSYTLSKTVNFGPGRASLLTVGYTLTGGARVTAGVAEVGTATGIYAATVTFADTFAGAVLWDTGQASPAYAVDEVNPNALAPTGLDAITVEANVNARQALALKLAAAAGESTGLETGNGTYYAAGSGTAIPRVTFVAAAGNRYTVTLHPPA